MLRTCLALGALAVLVVCSGMAGATDQEEGSPGIFLLWNGLKVNAEKAAVLVPPGEEQLFRFSGAPSAADVSVASCDGFARCTPADGAASWQAPLEPGNYKLSIKLEVHPWLGSPLGRVKPGEKMFKKLTLTCLVGFPSSLMEDGKLNGFELGEYPDWREKTDHELYKPPAYFYYLDYGVMGFMISEHIKLGDLAYDGRAAMPQYFALDYDLVRKLEVIHETLRARGLPARFHFIGGAFISPRSNQIRTSRNRAAATLSRHMWGEAVDFIIDEDPRDDVMDDLNQDGVIDVRDAFYLRDMVTDLEEEGRVKMGGFGVYAPPRNSRIQVHVDVRGFQTRWGIKEWDPVEFAGVPPTKSLRPGGKK